MKRALIPFAMAMLLMTTAQADTFDWAPGGVASTSPVYSLPIHVIDGVRSTLKGRERRQQWTQEMTRALDAWGLPYYVTRQSEDQQAYIATDVNVSTYGCDPLTVPDAVIMIRTRFANSGDSAGWSDTMQGGIMFLSPWSGWWDGSHGNITGVVAHEFGHAIGFQHGGTGTMSGATKPNDQERALAKEYYGV